MKDTLINLLQEAVITHTSSAAIYYRNHKDNKNTEVITYSELYNRVKELGTGLMAQGIKPGTHVVIIAGRSHKSIITDMSLNGCGAIIIPINPEIEDSEMNQILSDSDAEIAIIDSNETMNRLLSIKGRKFRIRKYIIMDSDFSPKNTILDIFKIPVYSWDEIAARGKGKIERGERQFDLRAAAVKPTDIAYIHYTAGTTSIPKGVLLSNRNLVSAIKALATTFNMKPNLVWTSFLPSRNIFERTIDFFNLIQGNSIDIFEGETKDILSSMEEHEPSFVVTTSHQFTGLFKRVREKMGFLLKTLVLFNRLWNWIIQSISGSFPYYTKGQAALRRITGFLLLPLVSPLKPFTDIPIKKFRRRLFGKRFRGFICTGNMLPRKADSYMNAMGIRILEGYGLSETCGFVTLRSINRQTTGNAGDILPGIELEVRDKDGKALPAGKYGVIHIRGPQVMQGYYKMPELTKMSLSEEGWLNTGDIGCLSLNGKLTVAGKMDFQLEVKPGQYIEPESIEESISQSPLIEDSVIVKDENENTELIIVPYMEKIRNIANRMGMDTETGTDIIEDTKIKKLLERDILKNAGKNPLLNTPHRFVVAPGSFRIGRELTINHTKRRNKIREIYG